MRSSCLAGSVRGRRGRSRHSRQVISINRIVCPPAVRVQPPLAPLFPKHRARKPTAIGLPTTKRAPIGVVAIDAFAEPRRRALGQRQQRRFLAQEALIAQPSGSRARAGLSNNADCVPRLFEGSWQLLRLCRHVCANRWKLNSILSQTQRRNQSECQPVVGPPLHASKSGHAAAGPQWCVCHRQTSERVC